MARPEDGDKHHYQLGTWITLGLLDSTYKKDFPQCTESLQVVVLEPGNAGCIMGCALIQSLCLCCFSMYEEARAGQEYLTNPVATGVFSQCSGLAGEKLNSRYLEELFVCSFTFFFFFSSGFS